MTDDNPSEDMPGIDPNHFGRDPNPDVPNASSETTPGSFADDSSPKDDYPAVEQMEADLGEYGELHVIVEEYDDEVELRLGATDFDYESGLITVDDG